MRTGLTYALFAGLLSTTASAQAAHSQARDQATVWYLRHAGYTVGLGDALLISDYQESLGMEGVTAETPRLSRSQRGHLPSGMACPPHPRP